MGIEYKTDRYGWIEVYIDKARVKTIPTEEFLALVEKSAGRTWLLQWKKGEISRDEFLLNLTGVHDSLNLT